MMSNQRCTGEVIVPIVQDIEQLDFITEKKARLESALEEARKQGNGIPKRPKIQRVSSVLKSVKADFRKYFEPRLVSLGPFHHGNPKFKRSEQTKLKLAALFAHKNGTTGEALFNKIKEEINHLKNCYDPEDIRDYDDDQLAWMFFVDGSAVLYAVYYGMKRKFEKLGTKADRLVFAQLDLFLLENQFPYRVLKILIRSTKCPGKWENSITEFLDNNLMTNVTDGKSSRRTKEEKDEQEYSHLLQRLRKKHLTGLRLREKRSSCCSMIGKMLLSLGDNKRNRKTFRSIKELKELGVHVRPNNSNDLKNITFYCNLMGSLRMPRLMVDDSTAFKFMNLVALEMCLDFDNDFEITSYLCFMDTLIDTAEDVKQLRATGMLHNYLGSDQEVADLFNRMSRDLVPDQDMYNKVKEDIQKYCNNPVATWLAQAYYTHFSSSWTYLAFLGAIMALLFAAIQAYFSLFPRNKSSR